MRQPSQAQAINAQVEIESTRRELLKYLALEQADEHVATHPGDKRGEAQAAMGANGGKGGKGGKGSPIAASKAGFDWSSLVGVGFSSWWHEHPARSVALLLESATSEYARRKPIQVVTVAAVAGAAVVLLRPWRMVSVTALVLSLLRSSNFSGVASSVLNSATQSIKRERL